MAERFNLGFNINIHHGDGLVFSCDVLIIKDWRGRSGGIDAAVFEQYRRSGGSEPGLLDEGEFHVLDSADFTGAPHTLVVGPTRRPLSTYTQVRELAADMLAALKRADLNPAHVATTLQGANWVLLDEREAFRAMLLGFGDAYDAGNYPPSLERITFVEIADMRARLMREALDEYLPPAPPPAPPEALYDDVMEDFAPEPLGEATREAPAPAGTPTTAPRLAGRESFAPEYQKPEADVSQPHVFVAMPFAKKYNNQFYLAIRPAVEAIDHLCIRLDQDESRFTGEIMDEVKRQIKAAALVIALLDDANPNVYLEVGYAWGVETPTLLLARDDENLPFDVRGHRCLFYSYEELYLLENLLTEELKGLAARGVI